MLRQGYAAVDIKRQQVDEAEVERIWIDAEDGQSQGDHVDVQVDDIDAGAVRVQGVSINRRSVRLQRRGAHAMGPIERQGNNVVRLRRQWDRFGELSAVDVEQVEAEVELTGAFINVREDGGVEERRKLGKSHKIEFVGSARPVGLEEGAGIQHGRRIDQQRVGCYVVRGVDGDVVRQGRFDVAQRRMQGGPQSKRQAVTAANLGYFDVEGATIRFRFDAAVRLQLADADKPVIVKFSRKAGIPDALARRREGLLGGIVGEVEFDRLDDLRLLLVAVGHLFRDGRNVEIELRVLTERNRHHELRHDLIVFLCRIDIGDINGDAVRYPGCANAVDELGFVQIGLRCGYVDEILVYRGALNDADLQIRDVSDRFDVQRHG